MVVNKIHIYGLETPDSWAMLGITDGAYTTWDALKSFDTFDALAAPSVEDAKVHIKDLYNYGGSDDYFREIIHMPQCPATSFGILSAVTMMSLEDAVRNTFSRQTKRDLNRILQNALRDPGMRWRDPFVLRSASAAVKPHLDSVRTDCTTERSPQLRATVSRNLRLALSEGLATGIFEYYHSAYDRGVAIGSMEMALIDAKHNQDNPISYAWGDGVYSALEVAVKVAMNPESGKEAGSIKCFNQGCLLIEGGKGEA